MGIYEDISRNSNYVKRSVRNIYARIQKIKDDNERFKKLESDYNSVQALEKDYHSYIEFLKTIAKNVRLEYQDFRERRLAFLNQTITNRLVDVFPNNGFVAQITYDDKYGKETAELCLIDTLGNTRKPSIAEGGLYKYMICYAAVEGVVKSLNKNKIYIDEAFGVASETKMPKIGKLLDRSAKDGMQIILISQNRELYDNIPHREICMTLDELTNEVEVTEIKDY